MIIKREHTVYKHLLGLVLLTYLWGMLNSDPAIVVPSGNVSGHITVDTIWDDTSAPYMIVGDVYVDAGVTLTISSGVEVNCTNRSSNSDDFGIFVDGILVEMDADLQVIQNLKPAAEDR